MKSKVKVIQQVKEWAGNNGTVYYHNVEMENSDKINIGRKKQLEIGDELSYEIIDSGQEYNKAKWKKEELITNSTKPVFNSNQDAILYQSTMKEVMAYFLTNGFNGETDLKSNMDAISDTCLYLSKKSKSNIKKLEDHEG